jgi:hypothetical protein
MEKIFLAWGKVEIKSWTHKIDGLTQRRPDNAIGGALFAEEGTRLRDAQACARQKPFEGDPSHGITLLVGSLP